MKKGAIELSFGMIFSIILIIAFLGAGFYAITKVIDWQKTIQIEAFLSDFQDDIDLMWKNTQGSMDRSYPLPSYIDAVCFKDDEFYNLEFSSDKLIRTEMILHLDMAKTTEYENPFCIQNFVGEVRMTLSKEYGETLVTIMRQNG